MNLHYPAFLSTLASSTLKNGLLGYWNFDGATGAGETDHVGSIGNLVHYTLADDVDQLGDGPGGHNARTYGTFGVPSLRVNTTSGGTFPLAVNFWIRFDANGDSGAIPFTYGEASTWGPPWQIYSYGGQFYTQLTDDTDASSAQSNDSTDYVDSTWHMFTFMVDAEKNYVVYVDGVLQAWTESGTNPLAGTSIKTFDHISFGHSFYMDELNTNDGFVGAISMGGIWNRALTAPEITSLYNSGNGRNYSEL